MLLANIVRKCKQKRETKLDDYELPRLAFSLEEGSDQDEVVQECTAQGEAVQRPSTPDIVAVRTPTAWEGTEAERKGNIYTVTPIYLHLLSFLLYFRGHTLLLGKTLK